MLFCFSARRTFLTSHNCFCPCCFIDNCFRTSFHSLSFVYSIVVNCFVFRNIVTTMSILKTMDIYVQNICLQPNKIVRQDIIQESMKSYNYLLDIKVLLVCFYCIQIFIFDNSSYFCNSHISSSYLCFDLFWNCNATCRLRRSFLSI